MQGTWKERNFGYIKDYKRKKQKRKHLIKEKIKPIMNKYYYKDDFNEIIHPETVTIYKEETKFKYSAIVNIYKGLFRDEKGKYIIKNFYFITKKYCHLDYFDENGEKIKETFIDNLKFLYTKEVSFKEPIKISGKTIISAPINSSIFMYNKPLPKAFFKIYGFYSHKNRKFTQALANKKDRLLVKEWIRKKEFYKPVKSHSLSKSISWDIY